MNTAIVDVETTGLDPFSDRIVAIGVHHIEKKQNFIIADQDEAKMLKQFWELIDTTDFIIGYNMHNFDWQFLKIRSIKCKVKISKYFSKEKRKDLMIILSPHRWKKLDEVCTAFGLMAKTHNGAEVPGWFLEGKIEMIKTYLERDLNITRELYDRMREAGMLSDLDGTESS